MSTVTVFSIFDAAVSSFGPLFECESAEAAKRLIVQSAMNDPSSLLVNHSSHFSLRSVGSFDRDSGSFIPDVQFICSVSELIHTLGGVGRSRSSIEESDSSSDAKHLSHPISIG